MSKYLNLISYFGGKYPHLTWLLSLFPKGNYHFIDIMCGAANVGLNVNYPLVTINDINDDILNLFEVLRDQYEEFLRVVYFTPFARQEHENAVNNFNTPAGKLEKARRYYIRTQMSFGGNGSQQNHHGVGFEYAIQRVNFYKVDGWNTKLDKFPLIVDRLRHIQIEKKDCFELFDRLNTPGNIIYFDPPYVRDSRASTKTRYNHEVDDNFHYKLAERVEGAKCFIAISGYESPMYSDIFRKLNKITGPELKSNTSKRKVQEVVWTNYDMQFVHGSLQLDFSQHKEVSNV